ncbi:MAG TPA: hypothetical protein VJX72_00050 [Candidatus Acidoferrum sp.]|nr:hypothetical protein [Candidatus Acidoferrum sp.]
MKIAWAEGRVKTKKADGWAEDAGVEILPFACLPQQAQDYSVTVPLGAYAVATRT